MSVWHVLGAAHGMSLADTETSAILLHGSWSPEDDIFGFSEMSRQLFNRLSLKYCADIRGQRIYHNDFDFLC